MALLDSQVVQYLTGRVLSNVYQTKNKVLDYEYKCRSFL